MPLFITEYMDLAKDRGGNFIAAGMEPSIAEQSLTITATSAPSTVFNEKTAFVMIHAQEATCLKFGTGTPVAVNTAQRIAAGETRYYGIPPNKSFRVAGVAGV